MPLQVQDSKLVQDSLRQLELAALPTSKEWATWWRHWNRDIERKEPWQRAIVDATTRLVKNNLTLARLIRWENEAKQMIKYDSDGHVQHEEHLDPAEFTREALHWFLNMVYPRLMKDADHVQPGVPEEMKILVKAVEGCYLQQARIGIELAGIKKRGYLTLNASAAAPNPQAFDERFGENI